MDDIQLLNIIAFCALMQNGEGIQDKSPAYVEEKFKKYAQVDTVAFYWGLDAERQSVVIKWAEKWGIEIPALAPKE